jgi:hypothetical protein
MPTMRSALPSLALLACLAGCAPPAVNATRLDRALVPPRYELVGEDGPSADAPRVSVAGTVRGHRAIVGDGQVWDLTIGTGDAEPRVLRYALPEGRRLPAEVGTTVLIDLYAQPSGEQLHQGLVLRNDEQLLAVVESRGAVPRHAHPPFLEVAPGRETVYRESGRYAGFCDAVVDHRVANVTVQGDGPDRLVLHPGGARPLAVGELLYEVVLLDNAHTESSTCPELALDRFGWMLLAKERPDAAGGAGGGPREDASSDSPSIPER